jgi:NADH-quinone oxidoreductase subunit J
METAFALAFFMFSGIAIVSSLAVISVRSPITSALCMVITLFSTAVLYVFLSAHLLAIFQLLVYAGAIMVLILFVIMTLNLTEAELVRQRLIRIYKIIGIVIVILVAFFVLPHFFYQREFGEVAADFGTIERVGEILYTRYALPIEIASIILLSAIIGAVVLHRKPKVK